MLAAGMAVSNPFGVLAENSLVNIPAVPRSISPDGSRIVGFTEEYDPTWTFVLHKSFIWTPSEGLKWVVDYDGSDTEKSGLYYGINDNGIISGAIKNDAMRLPVNTGGGDFRPTRAGEEKGLPIFTAAVWRDGKRYMLGGALGSIDQYDEESDGSYAIASSADGDIVVGYEQKAFMPVKIAAWKYDSTTDEYKYVKYPVERSAIGSYASGISPDGRYVWGNVVMPGADGSVTYPAVWEQQDNCRLIELPDMSNYIMGSGATAMSADGSKLLVYGAGLTSCCLGIYHIADEQLQQIELPANTNNVFGYAITDDGDIFYKTQDKDFANRYYYYDHSTGLSTPTSDYLAECAEGIDGLQSLASSEVKAVTGDGKKILYINSNYGQASGASLLTLDNPRILAAPAPADVRLYYSAPDVVTCAWSGIELLPEGITLRGYEVYIDDELIETKEASAEGGEFAVTCDAIQGKRHNCYVRTLYTKGGKDCVSGLSETVYTFISENMELFSFDNFDDCEVDGYGNPIYVGDDWAAEDIKPNPMVIDWSLDIRDWDNNNPFASVTSTAVMPWANAYVSRYHDATDADDFFLSFYVMSKEVNFLGQNRTTDYLDIEYTTDGAEWIRLMRICAADMQHTKWNFFKTDLGKELAGKVFRLRFNAHGEGRAQLIWAVDCINISDKMEAARPEGLRVIGESDDGVELTWLNTMNTYDASYIANSYVECDLSAANEGNPIMMAVDLTPDKLKPYREQYISGVSTFIYDNPGSFGDGSSVEAVVFEDGKEVARTNFTGPFNKVASSTAWLPNPVKIQAGKTYRVAVDLVSYEVDSAPIYYQNMDACVPGKSDLFSEDNGQTWQSMHDVYAQMYPGSEQESDRKKGNCIWSIHADITDSPVTDSRQKDPEIIGYVVYRDGKQINEMVVYSPYMKFIDTAPLEKADYTVQAFYKDGRVSPMSEPLRFTKGSGVRTVGTHAVKVIAGEGAIRIDGNFDKAVLYSLSGMRMLTTRAEEINTAGLADGLYLLQINAGDHVEIHKVMVR